MISCLIVDVSELRKARLPTSDCVAVDCLRPYLMLEKELKIVHYCILHCETDTEYPAVQ